MDVAYLKENYKVDSALKSVGLGHLSQLFSKKGVSADVFLNLSRDDLEYLGVTKVEEQDKILKEIQPFSNLYKYLENSQNLNLTHMLRISVKHLKWVESVLSHLYANVRARRHTNGMIDDSHSLGSAVVTLSDAMLAQVQYIQSASVPKAKSKRKSFKIVVIGSSVVLPLIILATFKSSRTTYLQTAFSSLSSLFSI